MDYLTGKEEEKMLMESLSESATAISALRLEYRMSRREFAEYFGVSYRTVQNWELGYRRCPAYLRGLMRFKLSHDSQFKK